MMAHTFRDGPNLARLNILRGHSVHSVWWILLLILLAALAIGLSEDVSSGKLQAPKSASFGSPSTDHRPSTAELIPIFSGNPGSRTSPGGGSSLGGGSH